MLLLSLLLLAAHIAPVVLAQHKTPPGPVHDGQPKSCNAWHLVASAADNCDTVPARYKITRARFLELNPAVSSDCITNFWAGYAYCVGTGAVAVPTTTTRSTTTTNPKTTTTTTSTPIPTTTTSSKTRTTISNTKPYSIRVPIATWNITRAPIETVWPPKQTQAGQPPLCNRWHYVGAGDTCQTIVNRYETHLTLEKLLEWNPVLEADCSGLLVDYWVCVNARSQTGELDLEWTTAPPAFTRPPPPTAFIPPIYTTVNSSFSPVPSQGPMPKDCKAFHQVESGQTCKQVLAIYQYITEEQFFAWNPVLDKKCDGLWTGNWYCVGSYAIDKVPMPPHVTTRPKSVPEGSPADCSSWYFTTIDDDCDDIAAMFGAFSSKDFKAWNPSVYNDCTGIKIGQWYCVGKPSTPTTRTRDAPIPTTPGQGLPTQTDIAEDCTDYWLVSETDTCTSIAQSNGISRNNLLVWNKALGPNCEDLKPNFYVCVATKSMPTTAVTTTTSAPSSTSTIPASTPNPVREGMASDCKRFYLMHPGDLCYSMADTAGISLDNFLKWNPAVGTSCQNLWPDYYYCIGVTGPVTTIITKRPVATP